MRMRLLFLLAVLVAIFALAVFSWFFTRRMIRPLEQSRKEQNAFIAAASHELRSPLAVIQSSLSAISHASEEKADQFIAISLKECKRMTRLIQDMLSLSRSDNHTWVMNMAPCEVDTLLLETYEKYEIPAHEKGLSFSVQLPEEDLPSCILDKAKISQILSILIENALSYVPEEFFVFRQKKNREPSSFLFLTMVPVFPIPKRKLYFSAFTALTPLEMTKITSVWDFALQKSLPSFITVR